MEKLILKKSELKSHLPVFVEQESYSDSLKEDALLGVLEAFLPKIQHMIGPAVKKMDEYFGDDEKIFLIRKSKGQTPKVIVIDNTKGFYNIANKAIENGEDVIVERDFTLSKKCVINVYDVGVFIEKMLAGELNGIIK